MKGRSEKISKAQAQKIVLHAQQLPGTNKKGRSIDATQDTIEHLGYIQIDTISVVQRAHHHTLWSRNKTYKPEMIEELVEQKKVFEYWSHAAAYLPMSEYRYTLPRKQAIKSGQQKHWYTPDKKQMKQVLKRIEEEGPLLAKDFEHHGTKTGEWGSKPAKRALENLFMQGDLMIAGRNKFHKVYDLSERVLPTTINTKLPIETEYTRFIITKYLSANGLGQAHEMAYLLKNVTPQINAMLQHMHHNNELLKLMVDDKQYFALPAALTLLDKPLQRSKLSILSPFDNLLIQRKRMLDLFDFNYLLECYVPAAKRQYGYFSLPLLWDGKLMARMDCKADRKQKVLHINNLVVEEGENRLEAFCAALVKELHLFMHFNDCTSWQVHATVPKHLKLLLK